jgi:hypothetical protein
MQIRSYEDADEQGVIALWDEVLPDSAPHNDPEAPLPGGAPPDPALQRTRPARSRSVTRSSPGGPGR